MNSAVQTVLVSQLVGSVMVLMTVHMLQMRPTAHSAGMKSSGAKLFNYAVLTIEVVKY